MADSKITALAALTAADPVNDMFPVVDVSDTSMAASGTTKRISANNILSSSPTASGALTVTGLVTAGSATITGDLTVQTNKLFVNATGVGVGTTNVLGDFTIQNGSNCRFEVTSSAGGTSIENLNNARNAYLNMTMYADAYIWNRLGTTAMTLNSNGLGLGAVPSGQIGGGAFVAKGIAGITLQTVSALATDYTLPIGAFSGIITIRSNGGGGSAVWMLDPNAGAVQVSNNIVGRTITFTFSSGSWKLQQTVGAVPSTYNYLALSTQ